MDRFKKYFILERRTFKWNRKAALGLCFYAQFIQKMVPILLYCALERGTFKWNRKAALGLCFYAQFIQKMVPILLNRALSALRLIAIKVRFLKSCVNIWFGLFFVGPILVTSDDAMARQFSSVLIENPQEISAQTPKPDQDRLENNSKTEADKDTTLIVIKASRPKKQSTIDARSYDIKVRPDALTLRSEDVIKKLPGVVVTADGDLSILNSKNIDYKVNNRYVPKSFALKIPASRIERVEIITNPGADSQGSTSTIINIITRNSLQSSQYRLVDVKIDSLKNAEVSSNISQKINGLNIANSINYEKNYNERKTSREDVYVFDGSQSRERTVSRIHTDNVHFTQSFFKGDEKTNSDGFIYMLIAQDYSSSSETFYDQTRSDSGFGENATTDFRAKIQSHSLNYVKQILYDTQAKIQIQAGLNPNFNHYSNQETIKTQSGSIFYVNAKEKNIGQNYNIALTGQDDQFHDGVLKYGVEFRWGRSNEKKSLADFGLADFRQIDHKSTGSAYISHQFDFGKIKLLPGIRYETHHIKLDADNGQKAQVKTTYNKLLPSLHFSRPSFGGRFSASATTRMTPPSPSKLNPLSQRSSYSYVTVGNRDLKPTLETRSELSFEKSHKKFSYITTFYHRETEDDHDSLTTYLGADIYEERFINLEKKVISGLNLNLKNELTDSFHTTIDLNAYRIKLIDPNVSSFLEIGRTFFDYKFNADWSITKDKDLSFMMSYVDKSLGFDRIYDGRLTSSVRYSHKLSPKLALSLELLNIGGTQTRINKYETATYRGESKTFIPLTAIQFSLNKQY